VSCRSPRSNPLNVALAIATLLLFDRLSPLQAEEPKSSRIAEFDPERLIHVRTADDALRVRTSLIELIWNQTTLPDRRLPDSIDPNIAPTHLRLRSRNVGSTEKLTTTMEHGVTTYAHLARAAKFNGCLFLYSSGHEEKVSIEVEMLLAAVLDGGCDLVVLTMPLHHGNPYPVVDTVQGPILLRSHDGFALLETPRFSPIRFFMEPVLAAVNHAFRVRGTYRAAFMAGLSGGGWTTTLYSALDERIAASFPVAGSLPLHLKSLVQKSLGDWEQTTPRLYGIANYLDLYLLATYKGRLQKQLLNEHDPCCSSGRGALSYESTVARQATQWGGHFAVSIDGSSRIHDVSPSHSLTMLATMSDMLGVTFATHNR
jgi:hypothetical protein